MKLSCRKTVRRRQTSTMKEKYAHYSANTHDLVEGLRMQRNWKNTSDAT